MFSIIDIGNTNTKAGAVENGRIIDRMKVPSRPPFLKEIAEFHVKYSLRNSIMCSVNPSFENMLLASLQEVSVSTLKTDHSNIPLTIRYNPASDVGSDRLVTAYEVSQRADSDAVIIDMGTAITLEALRKGGIYLGGWIVPGIHLMRNSLHDHTALLPLAEIVSDMRPEPANTTEQAVAGGIFRAVSTMVPAMVNMLGQTLDNPSVFLTGGDAWLFQNIFPDDWHTDPDIVMCGLIRLYEIISHG